MGGGRGYGGKGTYRSIITLALFLTVFVRTRPMTAVLSWKKMDLEKKRAGWWELSGLSGSLVVVEEEEEGKVCNGDLRGCGVAAGRARLVGALDWVRNVLCAWWKNVFPVGASERDDVSEDKTTGAASM